MSDHDADAAAIDASDAATDALADTNAASDAENAAQHLVPLCVKTNL